MINLGYLIILAVVAILAIVWVLASMGYTLRIKSVGGSTMSIGDRIKNILPEKEKEKKRILLKQD